MPLDKKISEWKASKKPGYARLASWHEKHVRSDGDAKNLATFLSDFFETGDAGDEEDED